MLRLIGGIATLASLSAEVKADEKFLCIDKTTSDRYMYSQDEKDDCIVAETCTCAELMTSCVFGPDHTGAFVTEKVNETVTQSCNRDFCVCTNHPNYHEIMTERVQAARDTTVKPTERNDGSISTATGAPATTLSDMGLAEEVSDANTDTFDASDFEDIVTID